MSRFLTIFAIIAVTGIQSTVSAQITGPRVLSASPDRFATLEEQLTNRLRATTDEQKEFIRFVVKQVKLGKLQPSLIIAIQRYAIRRNPEYPLPFFEKALRVEAEKRRVIVPPVRSFVSTAIPLSR